MKFICLKSLLFTQNYYLSSRQHIIFLDRKKSTQDGMCFDKHFVFNIEPSLARVYFLELRLSLINLDQSLSHPKNLKVRTVVLNMFSDLYKLHFMSKIYCALLKSRHDGIEIITEHLFILISYNFHILSHHCTQRPFNMTKKYLNIFVRRLEVILFTVTRS